MELGFKSEQQEKRKGKEKGLGLKSKAVTALFVVPGWLTTTKKQPAVSTNYKSAKRRGKKPLSRSFYLSCRFQRHESNRGSLEKKRVTEQKRVKLFFVRTNKWLSRNRREKTKG